MKQLNGMWNNGTERISIYKVSKNDNNDMIHYHKVDENGNSLDNIPYVAYAEERLASFIKESTGEKYKVKRRG